MGDKVIVKNDVPRQPLLFDQSLQRESVCFPIAASDFWMGCTEHDIEHIGKLWYDGSQRLNDAFNALLGAEQTKGQYHAASCGIKLILVDCRGEKRHIGRAMVNQKNFLARNAIDISQHLYALLGLRHDQYGMFTNELERPQLAWSRLCKHCMQCGHHGLLQVAEEIKNIVPILAAVDTKLVL